MSLNPAMFVPGMALAGAVQGVLQAIHVQEETIKEIVAILEEYSGILGESRPATIRQSAFGGSWSGESLGHHTQLAHDHVYKAMTEMMETLSGTGERVRAYHDEIVFQDEDSAGRSTTTQGRVSDAFYRAPVGPAAAPVTRQA